MRVVYTHTLELVDFQVFSELRDRGLVPYRSVSTSPSARAALRGTSLVEPGRDGGALTCRPSVPTPSEVAS